jgi:glucose/arabinose dehydrogenase
MSWPAGKLPAAPAGFEVSLFAEELDHPRTIYILPNSDVLVVESLRRDGESRVLLFRDTNKDGKPDARHVFLRGLKAAFGMTLVGSRLYLGNADGIVVFPYSLGDTRIQRQPEKILDLPPGGHYTRNIIADAKGVKFYVAVGSASNVDEQRVDQNDPRRAAILQINRDGSGMTVFASGLRNPVGMDWEPSTKPLWTVVNERDMLGDELVPDYLTSVRPDASTAGPMRISVRTRTRAKKASGRISSRKRSNRTTLSAPTSLLSDWLSIRDRIFPSATTAALSSACTARGTAPLGSATKSPSYRFKTASRAER